MSFAILRHAKIKSTTKGAAISHNHRLSDEAKINIDKAKSHLNVYFAGTGAKDRIDAKVPKKHRKDAVVAVEILLTSGPEFFDAIEADREKLMANPKFRTWVSQSIEWAQKEFGANLVDAVLHMDESTPHIHVLSVPLTKDGRLCAKEVTARPEMQRRQTQYADAMRVFGLERGTPASETRREHIPLKSKPGSGGKIAQEAKAQADLLAQVQSELVTVKSELVTVKSELVQVNEKFDALMKKSIRQLATNVRFMGDLNKLDAEKKALLKTSQGYKDASLEIKKIASERARELVAKITELSKENADALGIIEQLRSVRPADVNQALAEPSKKDQKAFFEKWAGIQPASTAQLAGGGGRVADVCGRQVVYNFGRGGYCIHTVEQGKAMPQPPTEQEKGGVAR